MRLVSFLKDKQERLGIEFDGFILDANLGCQKMLVAQGEPAPQRLADALLPSLMQAFLEGGARCLEQARQGVEFTAKLSDVERGEILFAGDAVKILSPVPHPGKVICVGRNYHDHVAEMKRDLPTIPVIFAKLANTICAHGDEVPFPRVSTQFDYEAELAVVIGKRGRYIPEQEAMDYVAGYTAFNDITVRDWQHRTPQWLQGKSFDNSGPTGPALVTADAIADPQQLDIRLWLNEELRQEANTSQLIFKIPFLISFISQVMTLEPGDIIATGTPGGVGVAMEPKGFMQAGDTVRVEIDQIGVLANRIAHAEWEVGK
ncbi:MAG: 2-hydroxyhepta-2,4-diene-1,7-dioate isomerase [Alicyclobacillus sp. RIFOXYA1_FULL_53_8]|nr:MAG: 2-hydroxyhepta-2,4-diene-1,7-dioate isomerase [Alicyclobacillus sp. RIFOXYA1_FULL_53_8]